MTTTLSGEHESVINTAAGQVNVRPFRSSSNAQLKAVLSFTPRVSSLNRENVQSQTDEFRGFFTLFWIGQSRPGLIAVDGRLTWEGMALLFARTSFESMAKEGTALSWTFGRLITRDALVLAVSDGVMVLTMFFCVFFVKALQARWFSYYWTGVIIQHTFQTLYLAAAVWWGYHRQWYWVQSGFLVLRECDAAVE